MKFLLFSFAKYLDDKIDRQIETVNFVYGDLVGYFSLKKSPKI